MEFHKIFAKCQKVNFKFVGNVYSVVVNFSS